MWVNLEQSEIAAIVAAFGGGTIVDKLLARPHAGTGAFVAAADRKAGERICVEKDGVIDRYRLGAYVMTWMWVSEKEAGLPMSYEWLEIPEELTADFKALDRFRVNEFTQANDTTVASGEYGNYDWRFEQLPTRWHLKAISLLTGHEFLHGESLRGEGGSLVRDRMHFILKALKILQQQLEAE